MSEDDTYEQQVAAELLKDTTIRSIWIAAFASAVAADTLKQNERPVDRTVGMYAAMEAVVQFALGKDYEIRDRRALAVAFYLFMNAGSKVNVWKAGPR